MTRIPRTELSPDTIKLVVSVLRNANQNLEEEYRMTCYHARQHLEAVIDACTKESKSCPPKS